MRMELRYGNIDRPLHPVQEEGLAPEARRRGPRGRDHGQDHAQSVLGRHGRGEHAAAPRGEPLAIKRLRGRCGPLVPTCISAVPFRDNQQHSSEQILSFPKAPLQQIGTYQ